MSRLRWSRRALDDLLEIGSFIGGDSPAAARKWVDRLRQQARSAARAPQTGRIVPELGRPDVRETFLGSYRIVYRILPGHISVLVVFEGHRQLPPLDPDDSE